MAKTAKTAKKVKKVKKAKRARTKVRQLDPRQQEVVRASLTDLEEALESVHEAVSELRIRGIASPICGLPPMSARPIATAIFPDSCRKPK